MRVRRLLLVPVVLLLLPAGVLLWLVGTESGLRNGVQLLEQLLAPALQVGQVQGRLAGRSRWSDVHYETDAVLVSVRRLELDWHPRALLAGLLDIRNLAAEGIRYESRAAAEEGGETQGLPEQVRLPLAVRLDSAAVQDLTIVTAPDAEPIRIDHIGLMAELQATQLQLGRLEFRQQQVQLEGQAGLDLQGDYPLTGRFDWQLQLPDYAPLAGTTQLDGSLRELEIDQQLQAPYNVHAAVRLRDLLGTLQIEGSAELPGSRLQEINPAGPVLQLQGRVQAAGSLDALQLDARLELDETHAGVLQLVFSGELLPDALQVNRLQVASTTAPSTLDASGRIGLGAEPEFDFSADWQQLAWPMQGTPMFRSRQGRLVLQGDPAQTRVELQGEVRAEQWLNGDLQLTAHSLTWPTDWQVEEARLSAGGSRLQLHGQIGTQYALDWSINSNRLADLFPAAEGSLTGQGNVRGSWPELAGQLVLEGAGLRWQEQRIGQLDLRGELDLGGRSASGLALKVRDAEVPGVSVSALDAEVRGVPDRHELQMTASTSRGDLDWSGTGDWDGSRWAFVASRATLNWPQLQPWLLDGEWRGSLSAAGVSLDKACWQSQPARACLQLQAAPGSVQGEFGLQELAVAYFAPLLPEDLQVDTALDVQGSFAVVAGQPERVQLELASTPGSVRLTGHGQAAEDGLSFEALQSRLDVKAGKARLDMTLPLSAPRGEVQAHATLDAQAGSDWLHGKLAGDLVLQWPDIALVAEWLPEVSELGGSIDGRVSLAGTPELPQLLGRIQLANARARLDRPGLLLEDISATLEGTQQGSVLASARLVSGGGVLQADGSYRLQQGVGEFRIRGDQVQLAGLPELVAYVSPELDIELSPEIVRLRGQVLVPKVRIEPRRVQASAVSVSKDQVIVSDVQAEQAAGSQLDVDMQIILGDDVTLDAFGLSGGLTGRLRIIQPPHRAATATGELAIRDGKYLAYGQSLAITTGRVLYAGGTLDEPGIDLQAERRPAPDIMVGIKAVGKLREPKVSLFSEPAMSQTERLSWLVFGHPPSGSSEGERSALESAALAFGLGRGESVGQKLGSALGLDEVSIASEPGADVSQSSLQIGKYLSPDLFVSYGVGLFEPLYTLKFRYALSSRWKLVGETSATGSGADLFYELDRY